MKDSVKITVIAAGFKEANKKNVNRRPEFLPKTWKAGRDIPVAAAAAAGASASSAAVPDSPTVVHPGQQRGSGFALTNPETNVRDAAKDVPADDLDVPTFLRRQAQKA